MNLTERAEISKETYYKLTNSRDIPEAPANAHRNFAQVSSGGWSKAYTSFYGTTNNCPQLGKVLTAGMQDGDTVKVRIVLKYDNIVPANGQTAKIWMQGSGNVTDWGYGTFPNKSGTKTLNGSGEIVFESTDTINSGHLKNAYWNWAFRTDYVASGSIQWKEGKVEIGKSFTPYTPAPEQLGWSTATLVPTQQQRYLWKFEYIYYSDGSVEVTQPVNISIAGADGTNGQTSHVHFAFADNATGGGFSLTTPKAYMGWYADFNETASNDPTKYKWGKWKGDQGVPGQKGDDGKTSYFHLAYASSADGKTGFSFKESGQQYQGYYTDFTQTSSTDPSKYTWMDRRAGVEVGGRNYIRDFGFVKNHDFYNTVSEWKFERVSDSTAWSGCTIKATCTKAGSGGFHKALVDLRDAKWQGRTMTYSVYVKASKSIRMRLGSEAFNGGCQIFDATTSWQRFVLTDAVNYKKYYSFPFYSDSEVWAVDDVVYIRDPQLEDGNIATTPAASPEDIQEDIDSKADQTLTQEQLNALAEKNNLIKAEMEAKASIDTVDKWITAYENYVKANDADKAKSEQALKEASERILGMRYEVNDLKFVWDAIDRFMSFQNEGLVIGKKDGSAYAKFSDDRISLFSGSSEVMYISQGTLNIANGIFTKTIQIGRFRFETHPADVDMLVLRYLGG
ncbi:hypothetical protein [Streptococcus lutetiensis]|uniref:hypothetical protein n=1 Tax=Streptococcus lutetiensis TaxID=150055 RepID=UPI0015F2E07E|nr:hypothetical protein [Streptococcus lutetiensis]